MINIYCDESCHLENDKNDIMVLGSMSCPYDEKKQVFLDIRKLKEKHNLSPWFEIKWTKVSMAKIDFYKELIDYFFSKDYLGFRGIVAGHKRSLDHAKYNNGNYDEWYYKMYFNLLDPLIDLTEEYKIMIDIKDTNGGPKVRKLHEVLCNNHYDFNRDVIKSLSQINSRESEVMQLTDLFIGILSFYHRNLQLNQENSEAKKEVIKYLQDEYDICLNKLTSRTEFKFNLFIWEPGRKRRV